MKRLVSLIAILAIIFASNCTRIPQNNDPVIGVWSNTILKSSPTAKITERQEWIFNDAYLGRYHLYQGNEIVISTDFGWEKEEGVYTISYPGLEKEADVVLMKETPEAILLEDLQGTILAHRE